jgi:hypothetical protein
MKKEKKKKKYQKEKAAKKTDLTLVNLLESMGRTPLIIFDLRNY